MTILLLHTRCSHDYRLTALCRHDYIFIAYDAAMATDLPHNIIHTWLHFDLCTHDAAMTTDLPHNITHT